LRAGQRLSDRAFANDKISFVWSTVVEEILGDGKVEKLKVRRTDTGEVGELDTTGVFIFIGHYPNSAFLKGAVEMDEAGYVLTDDKMQTSVPGVFAAGEIQDPVWRQVATSVGQGCMAGMAAVQYVDELEG
jgi:thioredoxin reductase (NADPH)